MKKAKALHPVPKPKPKPKGRHHGPRQAAPPHPAGPASHGTAPPAPPAHHKPGAAHHAKPGRPHHAGKPKRPKRKQPVRKLALGEMVACCSAEAVAMSLRLAGWPVTDADVLALYYSAAGGPDDGASIGDTLDAAARFGLVGVTPRAVAHLDGSAEPDGYLAPAERGAACIACAGIGFLFGHGLILGPGLPSQFREQRLHLADRAGVAADVQRVEVPAAPAAHVEDIAGLGDERAHAVLKEPVPPVGSRGHGLILGLALPEGPHAVYATPAGWWSWGELHDPGQFPGAVIEEAWAVTW